MRSVQQQYAKKKRDYEAIALGNKNEKGVEQLDDTSLEGLRKSITARYTDAERLLYEKLKKESSEVKSKHIKAEIRKLHIETSVLEKEIHEKAEMELKRIKDAAESEESHLRKRQVKTSIRITSLTSLGLADEGDGRTVNRKECDAE